MSDSENSSEYCSESKSEGIGRSSESKLEREYLKSEQVFSQDKARALSIWAFKEKF